MNPDVVLDGADLARKRRREAGIRNPLIVVQPDDVRCTKTTALGQSEYRCIDRTGHSGGHHYQRVR